MALCLNKVNLNIKNCQDNTRRFDFYSQSLKYNFNASKNIYSSNSIEFNICAGYSNYLSICLSKDIIKHVLLLIAFQN